MESKKILYLYDQECATVWYRGKVPAAELIKKGHEVTVANGFYDDDYQKYDIFIFEHLPFSYILDLAKKANSLGKLTVFAIDDDYWNIHYTNPAFPGWNQPGVLADLSKVAKECKLITTTTPYLAERLSHFNSNIKMISNNLPAEYWPKSGKVITDISPIVIGWAGSVTHYNDLREAAHILPQILEMYPQVEVHLAGAHPDWFVAHERLKFLKPVPIEEYSSLLGTFDIALAPIVDIKFNASKSDLKVVEYSMIGIPIIASKGATYSNSIVHGETGYLAKNSKDWLRFLKLLIEDVELRKTIGANAREFAETRTIDKNIHLWENAYNI